MEMQAKGALVDSIRSRYYAARKMDKSRILDEFVAITGHQRKYALRLLAAIRKRPRQTGMGAAGGLGWRLVFELGGDDATGSGKLFAVSLVAAFLFAIDPNSFGMRAPPDVWHQFGVVGLAGQ